VFWVISVYFNIRNTLPKFCPFLLGHPVYNRHTGKMERYKFLWRTVKKWKRLSVDKVCQHISELPNTEFNYNSFGITEAVAHF
jgi:hypothetical protein